MLWRQVEKAPLESYADVGGLEQQVQEIKEAVELPLTHPELYEDIGIKPPKVFHSGCCLLCACHAAHTTADAQPSACLLTQANACASVQQCSAC